MSKRSAQKFEAEEVTDITARADHRAAAAMARYTVEAADQVRRAAMSDLLDLGGELRSTTTSTTSADYESCDDDADAGGVAGCVGVSGASVASGASALRYRPRDELLQRIDRKMDEILAANKRMRLTTKEMNARMEHLDNRLNHIETSVSDTRDYEEAAVPERRAILALLHAGGAHVASPDTEPSRAITAAEAFGQTYPEPPADLAPADLTRWWKDKWAAAHGRS
jgi:hypothetical protein